MVLPNNTMQADISERVLDDNFIDMAIDCTNSHGQGDSKYAQYIGNIPCVEKGREFMHGYLAIRLYFDFKYAWSTDTLKNARNSKSYVLQ